MADNLYATMKTLEFIDEIVGRMGPITLDTRIVSHAWLEEDRPEIILTIGRADHRIKIKDVLEAFNTITDDMFDPDRSYFFEGIRFSTKDKKFYINWGS